MILISTELSAKPIERSLFGETIYFSGDTSLLCIRDLKGVLQKYTGKSIVVRPNQTVSTGIHIIAQPLSDKDGQQFDLEVTQDKATLWYSDYQGQNNSLNNAVYYLLELLDVHWLSSNANGLVIPFLIKIPPVEKKTITYAFRDRLRSGTGDIDAVIPASSGVAQVEFSLNGLSYGENWRRHNIRSGFYSDFLTSGHMGGAFYLFNKAVCDAHPEWFSGESGKTAGRIRIEIPAAVEAWINWVVSMLPTDSTFKTVLTDPEDGRGGPDDPLPPDGFAGITGWNHADKWMWLANKVAERFNEDDGHTKISIQSYGDGPYVALAPKFTMRKNVRVNLNAWSFQTAYIPREAMFPAWAEKISGKATAYDYLNITQWSQGLPQMEGALTGLAKKNKIYLNNKVNGVTIETTDSNLVSPIYWVYSKILRDPSADPTALWFRYFQLYFGNAQVPMMRMYDRWMNKYTGPAEVSFALRDISEAVSLVPKNSIYWRRVMDYAAYVHYIKMYYAAADKNSLYPYLYRIHHLQMIQTPAFISQRYFGAVPNADEVEPISYPEVAAQLAADIADAPVLYEVVAFNLDRRNATLLEQRHTWWYRTGQVPYASFYPVSNIAVFDIGIAAGSESYREFDIISSDGLNVLSGEVTPLNYDRVETAPNGASFYFKRFTLQTQPGKEYTIRGPQAVQMVSPDVLWITGWPTGFDHAGYPPLYIWVPENATEIVFTNNPVNGQTAKVWDGSYTGTIELLKDNTGDYEDLYRVSVPVEHRGKCWELAFGQNWQTILNLPNAVALQPFNYT